MLLLLDFLKNWNTIQQQLEANDLNLNLTETYLLIRNELPTLKIFQQLACLLFANHNRSETVVLWKLATLFTVQPVQKHKALNEVGDN